MIKFQNMGLQKLVILGDLGDWNFYVIKCFPIDTNTLKYCHNSEFDRFKKIYLHIAVQILYIEI